MVFVIIYFRDHFRVDLLQKETDKKSHNPIRCIKIPMSFFEREEEQEEKISMKDKENIL